MIRSQVLLSGFGYYVCTETLKDLFQRILRVIAEKACGTQVYTCVAGNQRGSGAAEQRNSGAQRTAEQRRSGPEFSHQRSSLGAEGKRNRPTALSPMLPK